MTQTIGKRSSWQSRDPLKNAELLQGANLYAYVGNDPINYIDPNGKSALVLVPVSVAASIAVTAFVYVQIHDVIQKWTDQNDEDDDYKPSNRDKKQDKCDKMGGEDPDPYKGEKDPKKKADIKKQIHDAKEKSGRGGADNIDTSDPYSVF